MKAMALARSAALAAAALTLATGIANAQEWKKKFPLVQMGSVTVETQGDTLARYDVFAKYFKETLGAEMKVFTASDYAGIVQALSSGQIQLARMGGSAYAAGWIDSNGGIEPLVVNRELDGTLGYHSVLIVKSNSVYKKLEDLKGKSLAWADPNSTSGYLVPNVALKAIKIEPEKFFSRTAFAGGHEQVVLGVLNGTYDAGFTWTSKGDNAGQLRMMMDRGVLKREQLHVVWESPLVPNPLWAIPKNLPADMKADLRKFFVDLIKDRPAIAEAAANGKTSGFVEADHSMYATIVDSVQELRAQRKKRTN